MDRVSARPRGDQHEAHGVGVDRNAYTIAVGAPGRIECFLHEQCLADRQRGFDIERFEVEKRDLGRRIRTMLDCLYITPGRSRSSPARGVGIAASVAPSTTRAIPGYRRGMR